MNERARHALLARVLGPGSAPVGIGDDAAVIDLQGSVVASVDAMVEEVHFRRGWLSWEAVGFKATMAALSDLAAMGAKPVGVLSALTLPSAFTEADLEALARGQRHACERLGTSVVGGNLARAEELTVTTTVLGELQGEGLRRDGARPGDRVIATGALGLARAGLEALLREVADQPALAPALEAWRRPVAQIEAGVALVGRASAAMDVSDGLALDLHRLAEASGLRIVLDAEALLTPTLGRAAGALALDPVKLAIDGGEDYVLVATTRAPLREGERLIGWCETGEPSLVVERGARREAVPPGGFDHFAGG